MSSHAHRATLTEPRLTDGAPPMQDAAYIRYGTSQYRRAGIALFLAGFASFSLLYCIQPLLPDLAHTFLITPAQSALALSLTTGLLALSIFLAGAYSQALGRKGLMFTSMALASLLSIAASVAPDWHTLLFVRALEGLVLGGVPAVAIAWLAEEIAPEDLGKAMGIYIGGTAFGGMAGRVGMGLLTDLTSWRMALGMWGGLCFVAAFGFLCLLPVSRHFTPRRGIALSSHVTIWANHLRNPWLRRIYALGFLLTSINMTAFNYVAFRLSGAPYHLAPAQLSMVFLVMVLGIISSPVSGRLADRFGRQPLLTCGFLLMLSGVLCTLFTPLPAVLLGIALLTTGFFVGHAVASASVGPLAITSKAHAASLYLLFYYMGSSITGWAGGWFWQQGGWLSIAGLTGLMALIGISISARSFSITPR